MTKFQRYKIYRYDHNQGILHFKTSGILNDAFLFVQTPKCGTTSLKKVLKQYNNKHLVKKSLCHRHEGLNYLSRIYSKKQYPDMKYLGITRNPFSRCVSFYYHRVNHHGRRNMGESFEDFLKNSHGQMFNIRNSNFEYHQIDGEFSLDQLFYFEEGIEKTLNKISDMFPFMNIVTSEVPDINKNKVKVNYREMITKNIEKLIKKSYAKDFFIYGYSLNPDDMHDPPAFLNNE